MDHAKPKKISVKMSPPSTNVMSWELRPGGMLVQKRNSDSDLYQNSVSAHQIRVRVKHGPSYHDVHINPQASFGEMKKKLAGLTKMHIDDQKLIFKSKERDSKSYLDVSGVKGGSKLLLEEDVLRREKRVLELRKKATMEKGSKAISEISLEVNKLAIQVSDLESKISEGRKIVDKDLENLTELLMIQVIKLDGIAIDGDSSKSRRRMQVRRVQKYIETLDRLKINEQTRTTQNSVRISTQQHNVEQNDQQQVKSVAKTRVFHQQPKENGSNPFVETTNWETFDSSVEQIPIITTQTRFTSTTINPKWELFE